MRKNLKGMFNAVYNGDFQKVGKDQLQFPKAWLQIGGNHETKWDFRPQVTERPLEITNTTAIRAGIIQTTDAALNVKREKEWLITLVFKCAMPETQPYLRLYPILLNGEVSKPWEYYVSTGPELETGQQYDDQYNSFKQIISVGAAFNFLRLETGILGQGSFCVYKVIAHCLSPKRSIKRVIRIRQEIRQISSIQTIGEIIKPIQLAMPIPLKIPVTVQANVNADIRNLTPLRDSVQIYGSSQVPLATSICGRAQVEISGHGFHESMEDVTANQTRLFTTTRDVSSLPRISFAVYNSGNHQAYVQAELSPDGIHWAAEGTQRMVDEKMLIIVTPKNFLRYIRLSYGAPSLTTLRIWVQAQN